MKRLSRGATDSALLYEPGTRKRLQWVGASNSVSFLFWSALVGTEYVNCPCLVAPMRQDHSAGRPTQATR
jgi:hypothetical protein